MIKRSLTIFGMLLLFASLAKAQTSMWIPDKAHSGVDFSILHMSLSKVRGHFEASEEPLSSMKQISRNPPSTSRST